MLRYLLERSGVIRQPVLNRVDFVHRTFQEYLAAKEAAEDHLPGVLVRHADSDQWRETIVMAAGHGTPKYRSALLGELLARADREPARARSLRLLATACLETAHTVDAQVTERVDVALSTVLPPRSTRDSRSLARAGGRVIGKLPGSVDGLSEGAAAACVRAVALINGPDALRRLAAYATDPRHRVQTELAEVWRYFDAEEYAATVLSDAPLEDGTISVRRLEHLPHLRRLTRLNSVWAEIDDPVDDLDFLDGVPCLERIRCGTVSPVPELAPLLAHQGLQHIQLFGHGVLGDLHQLNQLSELRMLQIVANDIDSVAFVTELPKLSTLTIDFRGTGPDNLNPIATLQCLTHLGLSNCPVDPSYFITELAGLSGLELAGSTLPHGLTGIRPLLPRLTGLFLWGSSVDDLDALTDAVLLERLNIGSTRITDLEPLAGLPKLREVYLNDCLPGLDISPLARLPRRARIHLHRGQRLERLDAVRGRHRISWS